MEDKLGTNGVDSCSDFGNITEECVIAMKVYGKCRQQDCLKPDFVMQQSDVESIPIGASKSGEAANVIMIGNTPIYETTGTGTSTVISDPGIQPGETLMIKPNIVNSIQIVEGSFSVSNIEIVSVQQQNLFVSDGYWKVTVRYRFSYQIAFQDYKGETLSVSLGTVTTNPATGAPVTNITQSQYYINAYSEYEKQVVLFGGVGGADVVMASDLFSNNGPYAAQNRPYTLVEAKATPLTATLGIYYDPCDGTNSKCGYNIVGVTIGLFTILKLFRLVNTTMISNGACDIPECKPIVPGDPCSYFNEIPFPFEDFDPPTK